MIRTLTLLALTYLAGGPLLLLAEGRIVGTTALHQALPITAVAGVFFALSLAILAMHNHLRVKRPNVLLSFFLTAKVVSLLVSISLLVCYGLCVGGGQSLLLFAINLFLLYLVMLVLTSIHFIRG